MMALLLWSAAVQVREWQRVKGCSTSLNLWQLQMPQVAAGLVAPCLVPYVLDMETDNLMACLLEPKNES